MKRLLVFPLAASALLAATTDHPTGNRMTPPTINAVSPVGVSRGTTVEMTVEGLNLAKTTAIYFSQPGITGKILRVKELPDLSDVRLGSNGTPSTVDVGPLPPRNQVTVEVDVSPDTDIGAVRFRLQTPLGTSPAGEFLIEPYYGESPDREPNDTPESAFEAYLPTILTGAISKPGDVDYFKIHVKDGEELVFENGAMLVGSTLQPVITILAEDQSVIGQFGNDGGKSTGRFAWKFAKGGTYYIRIADYEESGNGSHFYRIKVGQFPLALAAWPLGVERGKTREISLKGYNLGTDKLSVKGEPAPDSEDILRLRPETSDGKSFSEVKIALGNTPEADANGANVSQATAQSITQPITINGQLRAPRNFYKFQARKNEKIVIEVMARRLGSELDSFVEVLDATGQPIERAVIRPVLETNTTLRDHDSTGRGIRLQSPAGLAVGDYLMMGAELTRIEAMPKSPDDDTMVEGFMGQRLAFLDTTSEEHALDQPVYKAQIHPPGTPFSPNGLPLVHLYYRNDDGGPSYSKDSLLHFTAPADGTYYLMLRDVRNISGDDFAYRLEVRHPRPDFRLSVSPRNPNIPLGGSIPIQVTAQRLDNFDGPIEVSLSGLPAGLHASSGTIAPGQVSTTLLVSAEPEAKLDLAVPLAASGVARIDGRTIAHLANPEDNLKLVSLMPAADIQVRAETQVVELARGGTAQIKVAVDRQNGFRGRVPIEVRNLPPRVRVLDVGLNGVLVTEDENERSFTVQALPSAQPIEQLIYVAGDIETRSSLPSTYAAATPILLRVK